MHRRGNVLRNLAGEADIETGALPGIPVIEIAGRKRVLIENHRGVLEYGHCRIQIRVKYGVVTIKGKNLELGKMSKEQLVVCGSIDELQLIERG